MKDKNINATELNAAVSWLKVAQDVRPDFGISRYYDLKYSEWCNESYPEVSGYIIPTLLSLRKIVGTAEKEELLTRAKAIGNWLCAIQDQNGKWDYVFDTGQVLFGLIALYKETKDEKYLDALVKGADWLVEIQEPDGNWCTGEFAQGLKAKIKRALLLHGHTYNTRTAWALLKVWQLTKIELYKTSAIKNLDWALTQQLSNGFYRSCHGQTHFQVYTARGFLESGLILKDERYVKSARMFAEGIKEAILKHYVPFGIVLYEKYNKNWKPSVKYSALTSNCQLAILLYKITKHTTMPERDKMTIASNGVLIASLLDYSKQGQGVNTTDPGIWGGLPGSNPSNKGYEPNKVLPWATKFFIDALLLIDYDVEGEG